jgi:preprotein translocase subunit SecE
VLGVRIPPGLPVLINLSYEVLLVLAKANKFLQEVKVELGKVTWPTRKETVATSWIVLVIIVLISFYLGACDIVLTKLMRLILG